MTGKEHHAGRTLYLSLLLSVLLALRLDASA